MGSENRTGTGVAALALSICLAPACSNDPPVGVGGVGYEPPGPLPTNLAPLHDALPRHLAFTVEAGHGIFEADDLDSGVYYYWRLLENLEPGGDLCTMLHERGMVGLVNYQFFWTAGGFSESMWGAEGVENLLSQPELVNNYFTTFKEHMQAVHACGAPVIFAMEPDPFSMAMNQARGHWGFDPTAFPAAVSATGHPDALASGAADSFAGFCKVLEYLRDTYAPEALLAPTIKVWASANLGGTDAEPEGGWFESDGPLEDANFWLDTGVQWDLVTTNYPSYDSGPTNYEEYRSRARYWAAVAQAMGTRAFIWRTFLAPEHTDSTVPVSEWENLAPRYWLDDAQYLADLGYVIIDLGHSIYYDDPNIITRCWLNEYYSGQIGPCAPHTLTVGKAMLPP